MSNLSPTQFNEYSLHYSSPEVADPQYQAFHDIQAKDPSGKTVGLLRWATQMGDISNLWVNPEHQRRGLATAMWNMGQKLEDKPAHSSIKTESGKKWAQAVGGARA